MVHHIKQAVAAVAALVMLSVLIVMSRGTEAPVSRAATTTLQAVSRTFLLGSSGGSGLPWTTQSNGWGPPEVNTSNGESAAGDGQTMNIAGNIYAYGLGVHAPSTLTFTLPAPCDAFTADIGVDSEAIAPNGVAFRVLVGGVQKFRSSTMFKADGPRPITVPLKTGDTTLSLIVLIANGVATGDHANWANAAVTCSGTSSATPTPTPTATATATATATPSPTPTPTPPPGGAFSIAFGAPDATFWPTIRADNASWPEVLAYERIAGEYRVFMASPEWATIRMTGPTWDDMTQVPAHPAKVLDRPVPGDPLTEYPDGGYVSINGIYRSGATLIAIYHAEYWNNPPGGSCATGSYSASIMWATSADDGVTWTGRQRMIGGRDPYEGATFCGPGRLAWGAGVPQLIDQGDGYMYIQFIDWSFTQPDQGHLARIPVADFVSGDMSSCRKWHGGVWTELCLDPTDTNIAGRGGESTCVLCRPSAEHTYFGTASISWNTYLGKWLALSESDLDYDNGGSLWLSTSDNLTEWSAPQYIGPKRGAACVDFYAYGQLLSPATSNHSGVTDQTGYFFYRCGPYGTQEPFTITFD